MKKGFSLLNVIILVSILSLGFILYKNYIVPPINKQPLEKDNTIEKIDANKTNEIPTENIEITEKEKPESTTKEEVSALPDPSTLPDPSKKTEPISDTSKEESETTSPGYFANETYNYEISFPTNWRIQDSYLEEITIGTIPPKNGQGAIKIKIGNNPESEIKTIEKEVKDYSSVMELKEEKTTVDGIEADKLTLTNKVNGIKTYYLFFSKGSFSYIISYNYESQEFFIEAETVVDNFKFISK